MITFIVACVPVPEPRKKTTVRCGRVHTYTPLDHPVNSFKASIRYEAKIAYSGPLLNKPLLLHIAAFFPRPKSMIFKTKTMNREWKKTKPDIDNIAKSVMDALNKVLWVDDSLVVGLVCCKYICGEGDRPHVAISIELIEWMHSNDN